ncbi:hypothetical protein R5R35_007420 [Gryllus longicercus]|uniref:Lens epithelium-derived growth factor integrase-binding domain-containing protein n=1 Tax=Gryllus longicercus TaxID=2509291 RepID=A0AAN9VDS6_9ORTH
MEIEGNSEEEVVIGKYEKDSNREVSKLNSSVQKENEESEATQKENTNITERENLTNDHRGDTDECSKQNSMSSKCNDGETEDKKRSTSQRQRKRVMEEIGPDGKWVIRTFTGYIVTLAIQPDRDRPDNFETERAEMMWNVATEINLSRLKHQIQTGEYLPDNAEVDVDPNPLKAPSSRSAYYSERLETEEQRQENVTNRHVKNITTLEKELEFVGLMLNIRESFSGKHQIEEGLSLLDEVSKLDVTPLMLTKNPFTMNTIYCLCNYAGMIDQLDMDITSKVNKVQSKARDLYNKFQSLFTVPSNVSFEKYFQDKIALTWKMFRFNTDVVYELVNDPTSMF